MLPMLRVRAWLVASQGARALPFAGDITDGKSRRRVTAIWPAQPVMRRTRWAAI
jgi:hypothetical protein